MRTLAMLVVFLGLALVASAQNANQLVAKPTNDASVVNTPTVAFSPEYTGTFYARNADGSISALPRTTFKVGMLGVSIIVPPNAPLITGPLIVKIDGSSDPAGVVEVSRLVKGKEKVAEVTLSDVGNRVFEVILKSPTQGDYAIGLKNANPLATPDIFVFRVGGVQK